MSENFLHEHLSRETTLDEGLRALADVADADPDALKPVGILTLDLYPGSLEEALDLVDRIGGSWTRERTASLVILRRNFGPHVRVDVNVSQKHACEEPPLRPEIEAFLEADPDA